MLGLDYLGHLVEDFQSFMVCCLLKGRINYGGGSKGGSGNSILLCESTNQNKTQTNVVKKRPRDEMSKENICAGSGGSHPPCKRGRKSKIDCEHRCGDCTVCWQ